MINQEHLVVSPLTKKHTRVVSPKYTPDLVTLLSCVSLSINTQPSVPAIITNAIP